MSHSPKTWNLADAARRLPLLKRGLPEGGLFTGKQWRISPWALSMDAKRVDELHQLGPILRAFQRACNELYFLGISEPRLAWVTELLDLGKPASVIELGRQPAWRDALPGVLRPDLLLAAEGWVLTEIDSVPGGMGVTAHLSGLHAGLGDEVVGGAQGMLRGFARAFGDCNVVISQEAADYEPEMRWLAAELGRAGLASVRVSRPAELAGALNSGERLYRFFELFDLPNLPELAPVLARAARSELKLDAPIKAFLEEKLWLALFHAPGLESYWRDCLGGAAHRTLSAVIPQSWVLHPQPLPVHQLWPGLGVHDFAELESWGRRQRELVIKISGYSPLGWGARSVAIGHDLSPAQWRLALRSALDHFPKGPYVMQRFERAAVLQHAMVDDAVSLVCIEEVRARLCPYYFADGPEAAGVQLGGVLATLCPADKKIIHGMRDAMLLPCAMA